MKITAKNGNIIVLSGEDEIETYSFEHEITFKGLMNYLLQLNLNERIALDKSDLKKINDEEKTLCSLIEEIVGKYNEAVDEYHRFIESKK